MSETFDDADAESFAAGEEGGEPTVVDEDEMTTAYAASLEASKQYWNGVKAKNATRTNNKWNSKAPVPAATATDERTQRNAKLANGYSMFAIASQLSKEVDQRNGY
jgi:hypothetical protein